MPTPTPVLQLGKDTRLKIGDGQATEAFLVLGGEAKLSVSRSPDTIDASSKDDGNYKVEMFGQMKVSMTVSGKVKLPDAGLARADAVAKSGGTTNVKVVDSKGVPTDRWVCLMSIGNLQIDYDDQQAASYSFTLSAAAAPTTDNLLG